VSYLSLVKNGKIQSAPRLLVYGADGVGKSSFAAGAPSPLFLDFDRRTDHLDVARLSPATWDETLGVMRELHAKPGEFKTLVIDTLDHMERLIHAHVCTKEGKASLGDFAFGKGFVAAMGEWRRFVAAIDALRSVGVETILLAHGVLLTVNTPTGDVYQKYGLKLLGTKGNNPTELLSEKCDLVGYAHFEDFVVKDKATGKSRAVPGGDRVLDFAHHPGYESKCGIKFPDSIPLSWEAYSKAVEESKK
jgi:hypothetical protein